jgi:hypothetical protein
MKSLNFVCRPVFLSFYSPSSYSYSPLLPSPNLFLRLLLPLSRSWSHLLFFLTHHLVFFLLIVHLIFLIHFLRSVPTSPSSFSTHPPLPSSVSRLHRPSSLCFSSPCSFTIFTSPSASFCTFTSPLRPSPFLHILLITSFLRFLTSYSPFFFPPASLPPCSASNSQNCAFRIERVCGSHTCDYEEYYLLGCNDVYFCRNPPTFRSNILPPSSEPNSKLNKKSTITMRHTELDLYRTARRYNPKRSYSLRIKLTALCECKVQVKLLGNYT